VLAERTLREAGPTLDERLIYAFRLLTGRRPSPPELDVLRLTYDDQRETYEADPAAARALLGVGEHPADPDLDAREVAALAQVASALQNFDETIMKR
jgi:hypothetical protein